MDRIELKMSKGTKTLYNIVIIFSLLFAFGALAALEDTEETSEMITLILGIIFF